MTLEGAVWDYGWTGTGDLFSLTPQQLATCEAATGECTTTDHGIEVPRLVWEQLLRLGGRTYES